MNRLFQKQYDKILLLSAGAGLLASVGWVGSQQAEIRRLREVPAVVALSSSRFPPTRLAPARTALPVWAQPRPESSEDDRVCELFAPPGPVRNVANTNLAAAPDRPWGIELVTVKPEPFRLQLAGYFGGSGDYVGVFVAPGTAGSFLARVGHRFENLDLTLESFAVKKVPVDHDGAWPVVEVVAFAGLRDERSGSDVMLDDRARKMTGALLAVFHLASGLRELHQGDTLALEAAVYRLEHIQLSPPEVVLVRESPDSALPETKILRPLAAPPAAVSRPVPPSPAALNLPPTVFIKNTNEGSRL